MGRPRSTAKPATDDAFFVRLPPEVKALITKAIERHAERKLNRSQLITFLVQYFDDLSEEEQVDLILTRGKVASYLSLVVQMQFTLQAANATYSEHRWIRAEILHRRLRDECVKILDQLREAPGAGGPGKQREVFERLLSWVDYRLGNIWVSIAEQAHDTALLLWAAGRPAPRVKQSFADAANGLALSRLHSGEAAKGVMNAVGTFNLAVASCLGVQWRLEQEILLGRLETAAAPGSKPLPDLVRDALTGGQPGKTINLDDVPEFTRAQRAGFAAAVIAGADAALGTRAGIKEIILTAWRDARNDLKTLRDILAQDGGTGDEAEALQWYVRSMARDPDLALFRDSRLTSKDFAALMRLSGKTHYFESEAAFMRQRFAEVLLPAHPYPAAAKPD